VFPATGDALDDESYYSVAPDWEVPVDFDDEVPLDSEGSAQVDGSLAMRKALN
jgi:hypothetical protein